MGERGSQAALRWLHPALGDAGHREECGFVSRALRSHGGLWSREQRGHGISTLERVLSALEGEEQMGGDGGKPTR